MGTLRSAFLRGSHEEGGSLLVDVFLAAVRAFDFALLVFGKAQNDFERLLAIITIKLIAGHGDLRGMPEGMGLGKGVRPGSAGVNTLRGECGRGSTKSNAENKDGKRDN
jgi:hypothetical protein